MPTIKDERLELWSHVGEAMASGDGALANLRMDVLSANFQDNDAAMKELDDFIKKIEGTYNQRLTQLNTDVTSKELNALQTHQSLGAGIAELSWWRTREMYFFIYRLAMTHKLFPTTADMRESGKERTGYDRRDVVGSP